MTDTVRATEYDVTRCCSILEGFDPAAGFPFIFLYFGIYSGVKIPVQCIDNDVQNKGGYSCWCYAYQYRVIDGRHQYVMPTACRSLRAEGYYCCSKYCQCLI